MSMAAVAEQPRVGVRRGMPGVDSQSKKWVGNLGRGLRKNELARFLIAIAVVQLAFWLALNPVLFGRGHGPHTSYEITGYEAGRLATPDSAGLASADFEPIKGPGWYGCCEPGYWGIRFTLTVPSVPEEGLGVLPMVQADNYQVRINGKVVLQRGRIELDRATYHGNDKRVEFVPAGAVQPGQNRVEYILVRSAMPYVDLYAPVFGPRSEVESAYARQAFMLGPFEHISIIAGFVLSGFALILLLQSENKGFAFALFLLVFSWTLKAHYYSWSDPPIGGDLRLFYYFIVTAIVPIAWLNFADQWTGRPIWWVGLGCAASIVPASVVLAYALWFMPRGAGFDFASSMVNLFGFALMGLTLVRLGWHAIRYGDNRYWEVAIFVLILLLAVMEFAVEFFWQQETGYLTRSTPFLILALAIAVFARSIRLFRSADQINQVLSERLAVREKDLSEAHERERDFVRRQAHGDERQRILRDMHDGLGSQLMSMLLAARRGDVQPERMAEGLQSVIDEMRLMIASMDSVGESLFAALALFRDRMTPRIEAAGMKLEWANHYGADFPEYGPRPTLQVFRILQEAVANALKHSGSSVISVTIEPSPDKPGGVWIVVADSGGGQSGLPSPDAGGGRGLPNMRARAEKIGAQLLVLQKPEGVSVVLDLPASVGVRDDEDGQGHRAAE